MSDYFPIMVQTPAGWREYVFRDNGFTPHEVSRQDKIGAGDLPSIGDVLDAERWEYTPPAPLPVWKRLMTLFAPPDSGGSDYYLLELVRTPEGWVETNVRKVGE